MSINIVQNMANKKIKILVALSGGVDSAVAAYLLKKQGYDVAAGFMKNFSKPVNIKSECPWLEDRSMAYKVAAFLDIPIQTFDFEKQYQNTVVKYLFDSYKKGQTPNPDILCNTEIKFKLFLDQAKKNGFDKIATGHYVRTKKNKDGYSLHCAKDSSKDQVYFLSGLDQKQLAISVFPLGDLTKQEVRQLAKKIKLPNAERPDSQGICFVGKVKLKDFLKSKIKSKSGPIINTKTEILGKHDGVMFYTIGQRKGLDLPGGPWFVVRKVPTTNTLIVGKEAEIVRSTTQVNVGPIHWIRKTYTLPLSAKAQVRYHQTLQTIKLKYANQQNTVYFQVPQAGIASGQVIAFYKGTELIASAEII